MKMQCGNHHMSKREKYKGMAIKMAWSTVTKIIIQIVARKKLAIVRVIIYNDLPPVNPELKSIFVAVNLNAANCWQGRLFIDKINS